jgi:formaldehyde-activating enzyme involved in methanogenesis
MADENPTGQGTPKCLTTDEEDKREQAAVLRRVLEIHPQTLTQDELIRDLTGGSKEFGEIDAVQRAVRELAAAGLLHPPGADGIVRPTRAALRYFELSERAA